jgi:hypothetical protein
LVGYLLKAIGYAWAGTNQCKRIPNSSELALFKRSSQIHNDHFIEYLCDDNIEEATIDLTWTGCRTTIAATFILAIPSQTTQGFASSLTTLVLALQ